MISLTIEDTLEVRLQQLQDVHSLLLVPAHQQDTVESATKHPADVIVLDLENSIPDNEKPTARHHLQQHINLLLQHGLHIAVRINHDLLNAIEDLRAAVTFGVDMILVPKTLGSDHLRMLDSAITELESQQGLEPNSIHLLAIIETLDGLANLDAIATSTPRLTALAIGCEELAISGGFEASSENLFFPAQQVVMAAKRAGILAYGSPGSNADFPQSTSFSEQQRKGKSMGFSGDLCTYAAQIDTINETYIGASTKDFDNKKSLLNAYDSAQHLYRGAVAINSK